MSADDLFQFISQALYFLIFVLVLVQTVRRPVRANWDMTLLFGVMALIVAQGWVVSVLHLTPDPILTAFTSALLMSHPYLLLRLVEDFAQVPWQLLRFTEMGLVFSVIVIFMYAGAPLPGWLTWTLVLYFAVIEVFAGATFVRESRRTGGVTRRRMEAVAAGSLFLGLLLLLAGLQAGVTASDAWAIIVLERAVGVASGAAYFLGFTPPGLLRRAWQEPDLRSFLSRAARLPRLPDTASILREIEQGTAAAVGAPGAAVGLWDEEAGMLRFPVSEGMALTSGQMIAGRAFASRRPVFTANAAKDDPANAEDYRRAGINAILAAPIIAGEKRLGVLMVYSPRAPIFAGDDLALVQLLADQAAVILESRALIDEAARVQAREEAARLKDDFLSAAAHDLKTPLTTMISQAQLLERRANLHPEAPADLRGIQRLVQESKRLNSLVLELLDVSRVEQGRLVEAREPVDLVQAAREICERRQDEHHPCVLDASGPVIGLYDRVRVAQLLENLVENAIKYTPGEGEVLVRIWQQNSEAHLTVTDHGIGIPAADLPHVFERFHRGSNVDDRRFSGMGLGLYICRGIAEQHGGRIRVSSVPGRGTTFHVMLPVTPPLPVTPGGEVLHE